MEEEDGATIKITYKLYGFKLKNDIIVSDVMSLSSGTLDLNGHTLTVNGNFNQNGGTINVGGGTLLVSKDYTLGNTTHYNAAEDRTYRDSTATIKMDYATGMVQVGGDLNVYSESTNTLQRGTLQIRGGLYQYSGNGLDDGVADNFYPSSTFNLVFSGTGVHEIYFESTKSNITGVKEENEAIIKITGVLAGVTLNNDIVVTGDMPLDYGTMNLNGHTLTVNGNLTQKGGSMVIGSGTLDVSGDYTLSNQTHYDEKEDKTYRDSTGTLYMDNATGNVNIKGDFKTYSEQSCSSSSSYNYFNKGTMTIYGNFYQYSGDGLDDGDTKNFVPSDNFNIIFTGEKTHIFSSDSKTTKTGTITLNKGGKVTVKGNLAGLENVENCSFMSDGTIVSIDKNTISAAYPGTGKVTIVNASNTKATINVTITNSIKGDVNCDGKVTIADAVLLQKWILANPSAFLPCWKTADLCEDNRIDVFDLCLLKRMLVENR